MTELQRNLSANLRAHRQRWGWSQADLAERADLSVSYLGEIETGDKWPSAAILGRLAEAAHVRPFQLFLEAAEAEQYRRWLEKGDQLAELAEQLIGYFENRRP